MYKEVIDRYEKVEAERRKKKAAEVDEKFKRKAMRKEEKRKKKELKRRLKEGKLKKKMAASGTDESDTDGSDSDSDSDDSDSDDDDHKMTEDISVGAKFDNHEGGSKGIRTTVRNLRIREDTAKYLYNLDPSSAYYDPKTRSMRADPRPHLAAADKLYAGDLMIKASGETNEFTQEQLYAWEASQRGQNLTIEAAPSAAHFMHKQFEGKKESLADKQKRILNEKYGNASSEAPDTALLLGQSEHYVQYGRDGRVVKGEDKVCPGLAWRPSRRPHRVWNGR
jgi:pre-mRNA-processing factor SLU7